MTDTPTILSLCDRTGNMVRPWLDAGCECWIVDIQHQRGIHRDGNLVRVGADLNQWTPPSKRWGAVFAFPPCTDLAVSGARWFRDKGMARAIGALQLVERCRRIAESSGARWMLENPVSTISSWWRKPDYIFDPCDYGGYLTPPGDGYTKKTCLWTGGGFVMPEPRPVQPEEGSRMHRLPPSPDRPDRRSVTPMGFALAVFDTNWPLLNLSLQERMRRGAYLTHRGRTDRTEERIEREIRHLHRKGKRITKTGVAHRLGMSREHLSRRYGEMFAGV